MKRIFTTMALTALAVTANARAEEKRPDDSMRMYRMQEIEVVATRASKTTPVAYTDLSRKQIAANNYGQDIPYLLMMTPSFVATSETGIGVGAVSMRLRGTDATRLNVTANGVPLNNPDSHAMYWYDTPDFVSAVGTIQVQRGAGTSTNGTGAFGGAINMTTDALSTEFSGDASLSYGSYNTNKQAVHISSGLMGGHWLVDARLTHIGSDGYVDRGATDLKSYMFQAGYYKGNTMLKFISFGGKASTYLSYTGATKEEMEKNGRRYHSDGMYKTSDGPYTVYRTEKGKSYRVNYYDDHTDNYLQINNQLILNHQINQKWSLNATGFYTYGYGYYKQYKDDETLHEYGLTTDKELEKDLIREKLMRNHFGGINASALYTSTTLDMAFGGSWSYYTSPHWGELKWVDGMEFDPSKRWYDNDVNKQDANLFAKVSWQAARGLRLYADMQYRFVSYKAWGVNDNYVGSTKGMQDIDVDKIYHFFNPKVGLNYHFAKQHTLYASFAIAQKEPTRGDFTDRFTETFPSSEKMYDYELGYQFESRYLTAGINFYYMDYTDQLVKTGQINENYDALNINVPESYRRGVELSASARLTQWFTLGGNAAFSQNRIKNYTNKVSAWEGGYHETQLGTTHISYSPDVIASAIFDFHIRGFEAVLHTQYVGDQYFTNYANPNMKLDAYCVSNLNLGYTLPTKSVRSVRFGITVFNIFNAQYSNNGYGYSEHYTLDQKPATQHDTAFYFPQAPINVLANVTVKF